jgi:hypothetical protein
LLARSNEFFRNNPNISLPRLPEVTMPNTGVALPVDIPAPHPAGRSAADQSAGREGASPEALTMALHSTGAKGGKSGLPTLSIRSSTDTQI